MALNRFRGGRYKIDDIKGRFSTVALDNDYQVFFNLNDSLSREATRLGIDRRFISEDLGLYVNDAVLPGSDFADIEVAGDRQGITERNAMARIYPDIPLTFYIDRNYEVIRFFESWIQYINPLYGPGGLSNSQTMRLRYPDEYKCEVAITKFNKDARSGRISFGFADSNTVGRDAISYRLFRAWPFSFASIPVSYQGMNLLQCTVVFRYDRYVMSEVTRGLLSPRGGAVRGIEEPPTLSQPIQPQQTVPSASNPNPKGGNKEKIIDGGSPLPSETGGNKLREDLAIWALSNRDMIKNVGTGKQRDLLTEADLSFPKNSKERRALKERALQGTYLVPGENGNLTSANRPLPGVNF